MYRKYSQIRVVEGRERVRLIAGMSRNARPDASHGSGSPIPLDYAKRASLARDHTIGAGAQLERCQA